MGEMNYKPKENKTTIIKKYDNGYICRVESEEKGTTLIQNNEVMDLSKLIEEYK